MTQYPINALKITIYNKNNTQNTKTHFLKSNIFERKNDEKLKHFYSISRVHNSYFIYVVYFIYLYIINILYISKHLEHVIRTPGKYYSNTRSMSFVTHLSRRPHSPASPPAAPWSVFGVVCDDYGTKDILFWVFEQHVWVVRITCSMCSN